MTTIKTLQVAIALSVITSSALYATNGSNLISTGAKSRAMGGTSIGIAHGAESGLSNVALITSTENTEISFGGTVFMPKVSADMGAGASESASDMNVIPEVSISTKITDNFYMGIGMWGTAGMGVDYRDATGNSANMNMVTNLQLMQFGVPIAYKMGSFSVGVTPVLQYGSLDMNYDMTSMGGGNVGAGVAQDLQFGFNAGVAYEMGDITIGASYKSQIDMEYKGQLSAATAPFATMGLFPAPLSDDLSTPAEIGIGASYKMSNHTVALDYKQIKWSDAKGYDNFNWDDQDVISFGYEYATQKWALRAGYNYAESPISDVGAMTMADAGAAAGGTPPNSYFAGNAVNMFNLLGFPAIVESHITLGGSYTISDNLSMDLTYVHVPEASTTLATMPNMSNGQDGSTTTEHSQSSVTFQLNFKFGGESRPCPTLDCGKGVSYATSKTTEI